MAAATLFAADGFSGTSTRAIAEAVGLRQASLFHYFPRKSDILSELLDRTLRPSLDAAAALRVAAAGPAGSLWALAHRDVTNLCAGPHNLGALQLLPESRSAQFAPFWRRRQRLLRAYGSIVRDGAGTGVFDIDDPPSATALVWGLVESVITAPASLRAATRTPARVADGCLRLVGAPMLSDQERRRVLAASRTSDEPPGASLRTTRR